MTKAGKLVKRVYFHPMFTSKKCTFSDGINGVIFSPATSETLLCECSALDYIKTLESYFECHTALPSSNLALNDEQCIIIKKLLSMRVLLSLDHAENMTFMKTENQTNFSIFNEE